MSGALAGLVALQRGLKEALIVAVGATLPAGLIVLFGPSKAGIVFPLLLVLWFPSSICAWLLRETRSQGAALLAVGVFAVLFVVSMHLLTGDVVSW